MARQKKSPKGPLSSSESLHDDAYRLQRGQFYPERHEANIRQLRETYADRSAVEIEAIYRRACCIDTEAREWVGVSQLSAGAKELLMERLEECFAGFSRKSLADAIERAIPVEAPETIQREARTNR